MESDGKAKCETLPSWRVTGKSVQGASHVRQDLPNQDAITFLPANGELSEYVIATVADGHGGSKYFRSHIGSEKAVCMAVNVLNEIHKDLVNIEISELSFIKRNIEDRLPQRLTQRWREAIDIHISENPFRDEEWMILEKKEGKTAKASIEAYPYMAYGTTLLAAIVSRKFVLFIQIGDGDILVVSDEGDIARPIPGDDRLIGNETTSLCGRDAWRDFRFAFHVIIDKPPAMILLTTDGYANSFSDEESFLKVGQDFMNYVKKDGFKIIDMNMVSWLEESSRLGSGDDITLAVIVREDIIS